MLGRSRQVFNNAEITDVRSSCLDNLGKPDQSPAAVLYLSHREPP